MDRETQTEIRSLAAQGLAFEALITHVLYQIALANPLLAEAINRGFDEAANVLEDAAGNLGATAGQDHTAVKALKIIEQLRTASLGRFRAAKPFG